ncbi:MAG: hypothetical protein K2X03_01645 [Bryobacteraceae bacterium]|nr:hypothetical protein [Bryobacteraceae bacterium]
MALTAQAAENSNWTNVEALRHGDRIGVVQADQKRIEGRFDSANVSTLVLESQGLISIPQDRVIRVYKIGMSRKKRMVIGGAVGLAAGAAVAATVSRRLNNEGFFAGSNGGAGTAAAVGGGAGIGLAVGSFTGNGYKTIYQRQGGR